VAKVLGSLLPAMALTLAWFAIYVTGVALLARPGVYAVLLTARELAVVLLICPLSALAALQLAVCMSSRVNDARSAQQIGVLIILPISGLLVAQLTGSLALTVPVVLLIALLLAVVNVGLMRVAVALFDRESILTRWK
jgi:ABC-2 type transport system permease protein